MIESKKPKKSDLARERIRDAARKIFSEQGYEGTTIRAVAAEAAINPAMVMRYFGNKEGLFADVGTLDFKGEFLITVPPDRLGKALVTHVLNLWGDERDGAALAAITRASLSNEMARERFVSQLSGQLLQIFGAVGPWALQAAPFVSTQLLGLAMSRFVWRIPTIVALPKELVIERVGDTVQRYFDQAR